MYKDNNALRYFRVSTLHTIFKSVQRYYIFVLTYLIQS